MVVFNTNTFIQLLIVAIPALIAMGIASLVGGDGARWAEYTGAIALIPLDLMWRLAAAGGSEDGDEAEGQTEESTGLLSLVLPSGGGHVFFLPNYLIGALVTYGLFTGFFT